MLGSYDKMTIVSKKLATVLIMCITKDYNTGIVIVRCALGAMVGYSVGRRPHS